MVIHELETIELVRPVDGYAPGTRAVIVSVPDPDFAWAEVDERAQRSNDDTGLIGVAPADVRVVASAATVER